MNWGERILITVHESVGFSDPTETKLAATKQCDGRDFMCFAVLENEKNKWQKTARDEEKWPEICVPDDL